MSNLISLIISSLIVIVVPKLIGIEEYGYWQLYLFYSSYVGFLHFGWNDGIYLRYGGEKYEELNKNKFFSQFYMLLLLQISIALIGFIFSSIISDDPDKALIVKMILINLILFNVRSMLLFILLATNKIKQYAVITILDRIIYVLFIILFLIFGVREFNLLIVADLLGKGISLTIAIIICKDIVFRKIRLFSFDFKETWFNIDAGIKLMFANIASMLIIGVVRFGIEGFWDVQTFGRISLTLSVSNLMMIFINSIGIVIYPILRRIDQRKLVSIYYFIRNLLMVLSFGILILYYPLKQLLSFWLPNYSESLKYMAILFPMYIYEGKTALLLNTYFKTLRKEKLMLQVNLISLSTSIILTFIAIRIFHDLNFAVISILVVLAFKAILAEIVLSNTIDINIKRNIILELLMTSLFLLLSWFLDSWLSTLLYLLIYIIFIFIMLDDIKKTILTFKNVLTN